MTRRLTSCSSTSPSFWNTDPMCFSTARSLMNSVLAMVALLRPVAITCEDLALPLGQAQQRTVAAPAGEQRLDHLGVEHRPAAGDLVQRADQLVEVGDPLLEQVAHAGDAVGQQLEGVVLLDVLREDDDADAGVLGADPLGGLDALVRCGSAASGCRSGPRPAECVGHRR